MPYGTLAFLAIAMVSGLLALAGWGGGATHEVRIVFFVFTDLFVLALLRGRDDRAYTAGRGRGAEDEDAPRRRPRGSRHREDAPETGVASFVTEDPMAGKRMKRVDNAYVLFNVFYEDGSRSSNRKVPAAQIDSHDKDASARAIIEAQDRRIAALSGRPQRAIKSIGRVA